MAAAGPSFNQTQHCDCHAQEAEEHFGQDHQLIPIQEPTTSRALFLPKGWHARVHQAGDVYTWILRFSIALFSHRLFATSSSMYRSGFVQAQSFRDAYKEFKKLGVAVFGVSGDDMGDQKGFVKNLGLPYPLLVDAGNELRQVTLVQSAFGVESII